MIYLFVDTNVVIDFIADRKPFSDSSAQLFDYCEKGNVKLFISSLSYSNIYYVLKKVATHKEVISILRSLEEMTDIIDVTKSMVKSSLTSDFKDFEDAIQYHTAISNKKIIGIVTRDIKGFKKSEIAILSPEEALSLVKNEIK